MSGSQPKKTVGGKADPMAPNDLRFIQGDIPVGMLKRVEAFMFFNIPVKDQQNRIREFRQQLRTLLPDEKDENAPLRITSGMQAIKFREHVDATKDQGRQPNNAINIAFSAKGLRVLGADMSKMNDQPFNDGQRARARMLGDDVSQWDKVFRGESEELDNGEIHGVVIVVASDDDKLKEATTHVETTFKTSIKMFTEKGKVRSPDSQKGHEHFGFKDGITQPLIKGLESIIQGPNDTVSDRTDVDRIQPGIILLGRPGDSGGERPLWATNGSFMAFRKLEQLVPEFNADVEDMAKTMNIDKERLGARLVGRWKSGTPVQNFDKEDAATTPDEQQTITFKMSDRAKCPLAAHVRKMNPRGDVGGVEAHRMLRRGIAYGDEVGPDETKKTTKKRGLLFACYQSSLDNGFEFVQTQWANNQFFPPGPKNLDSKFKRPGVDPLIGVQATRLVLGADPSKADESLPLKRPWVVSRGGEYFFAPSITALGEAPFTASD